MYISAVPHRGGKRYALRETYRDVDVWRYRDLMDLGEDPADFIEYAEGYDFHFKPELENNLLAHGVAYSPQDLESVFLPFFRPQIRRFLENWRTPRFPSAGSNACSADELAGFQKELHPFDVRRLHYLKFGRMDMGALEGRTWKFLNVLSCKCRDEIEATIDEMERALPPMELASYVYTSLHLQTHFRDRFFRDRPFGLDLDEVDSCLLRELCKLSEDERFFRGADRTDDGSLHPYLVKYAVFHFDGSFAPNVHMDEFLREFTRRRRSGAVAPSQPSMAFQEACEVLGIPPDEFLKMERKEFVRFYRRKALRMHPDQGGDHHTFVRLKEAYEMLIARKV